MSVKLKKAKHCPVKYSYTSTQSKWLVLRAMQAFPQRDYVPVDNILAELETRGHKISKIELLRTMFELIICNDMMCNLKGEYKCLATGLWI